MYTISLTVLGLTEYKADICAMCPTILTENIRKKSSFLCVGLDTDLQKIPSFLLHESDPVVSFNRHIIESTQEYAVAYKMNIAFYESMGTKGWDALEKTLECIPENVMTIADAKRGDIGNTSQMYARTFFETYDFDAITVAPYMGKDSVAPFLEFEDKWVFLLALTSNPGSKDFQFYGDPSPLFEQVITKALKWERQYSGNLGFVAGATQGDMLGYVRGLAPTSILLIPGVGAQGGDLDTVCKVAGNDTGGILINSSRGIIYAGKDEGFADAAKAQAAALQQQMAIHIRKLLPAE